MKSDQPPSDSGTALVLTGGGTLMGDVYLRFKDGDDPNTKTIHVAARDSFVFDLTDVSYNVVRGFTIQGAPGVLLRGADCHHNVIEQNTLQNGHMRVSIINGATENTIRDNTITNKYLTPSIPFSRNKNV